MKKLTSKQREEIHGILVNTALGITATLVTMGIQILVTAGVSPKIPLVKEKRTRMKKAKVKEIKTTKGKTTDG